MIVDGGIELSRRCMEGYQMGVTPFDTEYEIALKREIYMAMAEMDHATYSAARQCLEQYQEYKIRLSGALRRRFRVEE